jgi:hypothetical protein
MCVKEERTEGEVEGLGREVSDDVGGVTTPQRDDTLFRVGAGEAVNDTLVGGGETTLLDLHTGIVSKSHHR